MSRMTTAYSCCSTLFTALHTVLGSLYAVARLREGIDKDLPEDRLVFHC